MRWNLRVSLVFIAVNGEELFKLTNLTRGVHVRSSLGIRNNANTTVYHDTPAHIIAGVCQPNHPPPLHCMEPITARARFEAPAARSATEKVFACTAVPRGVADAKPL